MRREGRQHGIVRTGWIHPSGSVVNRLDSRPAFGVFAKVPSKPTNHSKFTGKSKSGWSKDGNCYVSPAVKSPIKSKGCRKIQSTCLLDEDKLDWFIGLDSSSVEFMLYGEDNYPYYYDYYNCGYGCPICDPGYIISGELGDKERFGIEFV